MTGLRKLYVDPEICTNGIEYHRMKAQSHEYETKQSQQDQIIETMEGDYKELSRKYRKLEADGEEKEHKWRDRLAKVEAENSELRKKTQGGAKKLETKMVAFTQTSPAIVKVQQSGESVSKEKVRKLQKRRIVSRDEYRREKVDRKELEEKLRNQPAAKIRVEPKTEYEATAEDEPRSKRLFRECRKRVGNYKEWDIFAAWIV